MASQVFNTLTEVIQGPCTLNQQALAHSRLWDAVGGFLFLFSHMQDKLSKHSSQNDLLTELNNLQKDMITMMLSMLEGNVVNGNFILTKVCFLNSKYDVFCFFPSQFCRMNFRYNWKTNG